MAYLKGMLGATFFVLIFFSSTLGQTLWFENFDGEADGATTGTAAGTPGGTWSRTYTGGGTFSRQSPLGLNIFMGQSMGSVEGRWATNVIDISAYGYAIIDLTTYSLLIDADGDYFTAYYILNNNGIEVPFYTQTGSIVGTGGSAIVSGSQLQVVVRMYNDDFFDTWGIEDLTVTGISTLYSTNAGGTSAWNQGTTWSTTGFGGAVCSCTPNNLTRVLIGSGYSINIPSASDAIYLEVQSGGALTWSAAADLNIGRGGIDVQSGGSVSSGASTTAQIDFDGDFDTPMVIDGSLAIGDLEFNGSFTLALSGNGTIAIADDLIVNDNMVITSTLLGAVSLADDITVTGNSDLSWSKTGSVSAESLVVDGDDITFSGAGTLTFSGDISLTNAADFNFSGGSVSVADDVILTSNSATFVTSANPFSVGDLFFFDGDNNAVTNNGTLSITTGVSVQAGSDDGNTITNSVGAVLNVGSFDPTGGDFNIYNSGTLNQSGNFSNISTVSNFDNLATGTWNWTLSPNTGYDADMATVMNNSAVGNTFNYSGSGAQTVINIQYGNLGLSVAGTKTAAGNILVNGNWTVTGSASFAEGTNTVTLNGSGSTAQAVSNPSGETFYALSLNNTSSNAIVFINPVTVTNTLNMTSGIVNLSNTTFTLGSGAGADLNRTASTTTNWMYGGSFTRYWPTAQTPSPTAGNLYGLFPLGTSAASSYRPVQISGGSNVTAAGTVTFTHVDAATSTDLSPVYNDGGTNIVRKHDAQFIGSVSGVTGGTNYSISVTMTGLLAGTAGDIRLAVSNGATTVTGVGANGGNTGTATNPVVSRTGLSVANLSNDFRITTTNSTNTPLPVELVRFEGSQMGDEVLLQWTTATELNNDFFTIHKLNEDDGFDEVVRVKGQGTTNAENNYTALDTRPKPGKNYYRLMQTDFDGRVSYSEIVAVNFEPSGSALNVYPNPVKQTYFTVQLKNLLPGQKVPLSLRTPVGTMMSQSELTADQTGSVSATISTDQMMPGMYLLHLNVQGGLVRKVIIE